MNTDLLQPAFVLHTRRYRDSSLLIDLFTRSAGRASCVARGALRTKGGVPIVQSFQPLQVALQGRGEVLTLRHVEESGRRLQLSGKRLFCGLYVNELVLKLTARQDPLAGLFDDYVDALAQLASGQDMDQVLRRFEVRLLLHIGLGMVLDVDTEGQRIDPGQLYRYDVVHGPSPTSSETSDTLHGHTIEALRLGRLPDKTTRYEARALMRRVLSYHLDGQPLRSRELFR